MSENIFRGVYIILASLGLMLAGATITSERSDSWPMGIAWTISTVFIVGLLVAAIGALLDVRKQRRALAAFREETQTIWKSDPPKESE